MSKQIIVLLFKQDRNLANTADKKQDKIKELCRLLVKHYPP